MHTFPAGDCSGELRLDRGSVRVVAVSCVLKQHLDQLLPLLARAVVVVLPGAILGLLSLAVAQLRGEATVFRAGGRRPRLRWVRASWFLEVSPKLPPKAALPQRM